MIKKFLLFGALFVVAIVTLVAIFGEDTTPTKVNGDKQTTTQPQEKPKVFKVGDVVKVGDNEVTITSAKLRNADQYIDAKNGKVLRLEIAGKNNGTQSWFVDSNEFNLYTTDGTKLEQYFGSDGQAHISGEVNAGKKINGFIEYDVKEAKTYELIYKPNMFTDQEIKFNIEVK